jgi:hypothetical protein
VLFTGMDSDMYMNTTNLARNQPVLQFFRNSILYQLYTARTSYGSTFSTSRNFVSRLHGNLSYGPKAN